MAWIELHQSLPGHRKTMRLRRALEISTAQAVGHLCMLWLWLLDNAPDGNASSLSDWEIAEAAGYEGNPEDFVSAMIDAGFLDTDKQIHAWDKYAGRLIEKREQNAQRMREKRARADNVQSTCIARANTNVNAVNARAGLPYLTVPNPTVPNRTQPNQTVPELPSILTGATAPDVDVKPPKGPTLRDVWFEEFWSAYPKKAGKIAARKAWDKVKPDADMHRRMLEAVALAVKSDQWRRDGGQYIPNPATWLNRGQWDDKPVAGIATASKPFDPLKIMNTPGRYDGPGEEDIIEQWEREKRERAESKRDNGESAGVDKR